MPIRALMVDVDGVLVVHPDPLGWSVNLERDLGVSVERLREAFFTPHFGDVVHGRASLPDRLKPVLAEIAPQVSVETLVSYWFEQDAHINDKLLAELSQVRRQGLQLHLATVQEHLRAEYLWSTLGLRDHFDAIHYAADLGWAKPADEFFAEIERRTGFSGSDLFFIDDKAANVEAAHRRGWLAALWTGEASLTDLMNASGASVPFEFKSPPSPATTRR
jgi:putative hydrolase of the HAD superfamily